MFSLLVDNSYGCVQHIVQYASLIVARYLHTVPEAIVHTMWLPLVACYPPASVNTSCQTSVLCWWQLLDWPKQIKMFDGVIEQSQTAKGDRAKCTHSYPCSIALG